MRVVTLDELYELEAQHDPSLVFHGTASCFTDQIEEQGWPVDWRPYAWDDIEYVMDLGERLKVSPSAFLYHNHDSQRKRRRTGSGAYFTYEVMGAAQYAGATGGETVRNALRLAMRLTAIVADKPHHEEEALKLMTLTKTWKAWVFESVPVVYAVRATDEAFPDEEFGGLVSRNQRSFPYQLAKFGEIISIQGDFYAKQSIAPAAIVAKAILSTLPIEEL